MQIKELGPGLESGMFFIKVRGKSEFGGRVGMFIKLVLSFLYEFIVSP